MVQNVCNKQTAGIPPKDTPRKTNKEVSMRTLYYIGLDIHKKVIAYCIKTYDGRLVGEGSIEASCKALDEWLSEIPGPWIGAMEATIFTG